MVEPPFGEDERDDEEGNEDDQTDRLARDLIDTTAPKPSPPPLSEEEGPEQQQQQEQPQQGKSLLLMPDAQVDREMALGDMITPRPKIETEQDLVEHAPEAAIG